MSSCALLAAAVASASAQQPECGEAGAACAIASGTYTVSLPETREGPIPALLFFHGAGRSGDQVLRRDFVAVANERGYAVIAPDGLPRPNSRFGPGWSFLPDRPQQRDELAFARAVLDDATRRFGIDRDRLLLGGFSIGSSLAWYLACADPTLASAYVPVSGAFWGLNARARTCAGPVRMLHTHGWRDETVPLEGRPLRDGTLYQGDVFESLQVMRRANGCQGLRADAYDTGGPFWQREWKRCIPGTALRFALHAGGHEVPKGWAALALDWFEGLEGSPASEAKADR